MGLNSYGKNTFLDGVMGSGTPATLHFALVTAAPNDASTGSTISEPSGGSYARVAVTNNTTNFPAASSGTSRNATSITFPTATGSWGTCTHVVALDASSGGNIIFWGTLTSSKTITSGQTASFSINALSLTMS